MRRISIAALAIIAVGMTAARDANAQYWLSDRTLTEGRGLRLGDFEFHPGAGVEFGYTNNVLSAPTNETPALFLRGTAHIAMSTLGPQRSATTGVVSALPTVNFRAQLAVAWTQFFTFPGTGGSVSDSGGLGGTAGFRLEVFPMRTWQFQLHDDVSRVVQGFNAPGTGINGTADSGGTNVFSLNRVQNSGGFGIIYAPNRGVFDARLEYENRLFVYENSGFQSLTNMSNEIALRMHWRFFPKTAVIWEGMISPTFYLSNNTLSTGLYSSFPIRTRIGINGLLTDRIGLLFMIGYAGTYFSLGDNASTVIGQAEVRYIFSPTASFRLGLSRDLAPSYLGNYFINNQAYAAINQSFFGRFYVSAEAAVGYLQYGFISDATTGARDMNYTGGNVDPMTGRFTSIRARLGLFAEYRPADFLGINATASYSGNFTDTTISVANGMGAGTPESLQWNVFQASLGVRVNW